MGVLSQIVPQKHPKTHGFSIIKRHHLGTIKNRFTIVGNLPDDSDAGSNG
jgi:hypothetical protein